MNRAVVVAIDDSFKDELNRQAEDSHESPVTRDEIGPVGGITAELRERVVVEVIAPVEHGVVVGEHAAAVPFRGGAPGRVAGEPELVPHGRAEEGEPGLAHRVEELPRHAVADHVEGTPVRARGADGVGGGGGREVNYRDRNRGGNGGGRGGRAVLRRLDVLRREAGHAGLSEGLDARRRGGFHRSGGEGNLGDVAGWRVVIRGRGRVVLNEFPKKTNKKEGELY